MAIGKHGQGLVVESIWMRGTPERDEYFLVCSGRVLSLNEPFVVQELPNLPEGVSRIEPIARGENAGAQSDFLCPTHESFDVVRFVASSFGDDQTFVLRNGAVIVYGLEENPQAIFEGRPQEFHAAPRMWFYSPKEAQECRINQAGAYVEMLEVRLLGADSTGSESASSVSVPPTADPRERGGKCGSGAG